MKKVALALSAYFDGVDDRIDIPSNTALTSLSAITLECWFRRIDDNGGTGATIVRRDNQFIFQITSGQEIAVYVHNGTYRTLFLGAATNMKWTHLAITYEGTTFIAYIDGVEKARMSTTGALNNPTAVTTLGNRTTNTERLKGNIRQLKIWNRALSQQEIASSMSVASYSTPYPNLVAHYPLSANANDSSGNANHGTPLNGVLFQ